MSETLKPDGLLEVLRATRSLCDEPTRPHGRKAYSVLPDIAFLLDRAIETRAKEKADG